MKTLFAIAVGASLLHSPAFAASSDRLQETVITAKTMSRDKDGNTTTCAGQATLEQGSLRMQGDTIIVQTDADGYKTITLTAAAGATARARQQLDGADAGWFEGEGKTIVYDERLGRWNVDGTIRMARTPG